MANVAAGEIEVTLDGKTYIMRPSFAAIVAFEDRAHMSVFEAMKALGERQSAPFKAVAAAYHAGITAAWKSHARPPTFDEIGAAIYRDGLANHIPNYMEFLGNAVTGEKALRQAKDAVAEGKPEAAQT